MGAAHDETTNADMSDTDDTRAVVISLTQAAAVKGVTERTIRRWLAGEGRTKLPHGWEATRTSSGLAVRVSDMRTLDTAPLKQASKVSADMPTPNATDRDGRIGELERALATMTEERDWLRGQCEAFTRALPPAAEEKPVEPGQSWWQRLWGRRT